MYKPVIYTILVMAVLLFLWWFTGGTITGYLKYPSPVEKSAQFAWQNFQTGLANIFEALFKINK